MKRYPNVFTYPLFTYPLFNYPLFINYPFVLFVFLVIIMKCFEIFNIVHKLIKMFEILMYCKRNLKLCACVCMCVCVAGVKSYT
jgi:uncharacterized membrane protein